MADLKLTALSIEKLLAYVASGIEQSPFLYCSLKPQEVGELSVYALSIMARYMPSAWRRIEGGDEDQYLALVKASLTVWERLLPEHYLQSIAGERARTAQPGSWLA